MLQIPGTSLAPEIGIANDYGLSINTLVDIIEDSDDSSDESSSSGNGLAYWKPACDDITILSNEIALAISTITECYFYPEHDARRVKIIGGNVQAAVKKLEAMESLMVSQKPVRELVLTCVQEHLHRHRLGHNSSITQNFVSFTSESPGKGVEYIAVDKSQHCERVFVPPVLQEDLRRMLIGEERVYTANHRWSTPQNLQRVDGGPQQRQNERSKIWAERKILAIGSPASAKPRQQPRQSDLNSSTNGSKGPAPGVSKYLDPVDAHRLRHWSQNVDAAADPTAPAEEPIESELPNDPENAPITRRVVADSDSDSDQEEGELPRRPTGGPVMRERKIFNQDPDEIRRSRANRRKDTERGFLDLGKENVGHLVGADAFYANVPRDSDTLEETYNESDERGVREQAGPLPVRTPRRAFGLDDTNDIDDNPMPNHGHSSLPVVREAFQISSNFGPSAYGLQKRPDKAQQSGESSSNISQTTQAQTSHHIPRGSQKARPTQSNVNHLSSISTDPVPTWPGLVDSRDTPPAWQGSPQRRGKKESDELVEYAENDEREGQTPLRPPPGLIMREPGPSNLRVQHLLDSPLDEIQRPPLKPMSDEPIYTSEEASFSTISSSGAARSFRSTYVPQTKIIRPDVSQMRGDVLRNLMSARSKGQRYDESVSPPQAIECIQEEDEVSTRKFYNTMNLQAPNRGKKPSKQGGASKNNQVSRAQQALLDDFQSVRLQPPATQKPTATRPPADSKPSAKVLEAAKTNPGLAALHKNALLDAAMRDLTLDFMNSLAPALEAARAFSGRLEFEMQIGQLMILPTTRIKEKKVYELLKWNDAFAINRVTVKFTNILTTHGPDVDAMLDFNTTKKVKTWNADHPGPARAMLEFTCHDNTGQYFKLLVKEDGSHTVTSDPLTIAKIGIHCPGRIWDTCAVLSGSATWQTSKNDLADDVSDFVSTVHVKASALAVVYFRPPVSDSFAVSSVIYKRTSLHNCQAPGAEGLQLKVTEVKTLTIHNHRDDKKLLVAFENEQPNDVNGSIDLHYEVAVIDERFDAAFEANETISVGDKVAPLDLSSERVQVLLDTTLRLVDKIDWIGRSNYGTIEQIYDVALQREEQINTTLPPNTQISGLMRPVTGSHFPGQNFDVRTVMASSTIDSPNSRNANTMIAGVRAGISAQLYRDGAGREFYYGAGGARVPVARTLTNAGTNRSEILPQDSASQYGGARRQVRRTLHDDMPPGFW